jgi:hypothetical protein
MDRLRGAANTAASGADVAAGSSISVPVVSTVSYRYAYPGPDGVEENPSTPDIQVYRVLSEHQFLFRGQSEPRSEDRRAIAD